MVDGVDYTYNNCFLKKICKKLSWELEGKK